MHELVLHRVDVYALRCHGLYYGLFPCDIAVPVKRSGTYPNVDSPHETRVPYCMTSSLLTWPGLRFPWTMFGYQAQALLHASSAVLRPELDALRISFSTLGRDPTDFAVPGCEVMIPQEGGVFGGMRLSGENKTFCEIYVCVISACGRCKVQPLLSPTLMDMRV